MKTILVTGGAGFIGSHLVDSLLTGGDKVIVVDDFNDYYSPLRKRNNISGHLKNSNFVLVESDIRDLTIFDKIFTTYSVDCVVHLAARAGVRPSLENPTLYYDVNVMGTLNLLESMRKHKVKQLVFASSSSVYGNRKQGPFAETDNTDEQVSPYGATKKSGELLCHTYAHLYGIKTTCLRFFTVYGPRNRPDMACYLFTDAIFKGEPIHQFGNGTTGRDYTYVADTVQGIESAITHPFDFKIINLGNSKPVLLKDLIATIEKVVGKKAVVQQLPLQAGDVELTYANIDQAMGLLNYKPKILFDQGLQNLYEWYKQTTNEPILNNIS
jgi:UDP-glucuronate 4-epimerase